MARLKSFETVTTALCSSNRTLQVIPEDLQRRPIPILWYSGQDDNEADGGVVTFKANQKLPGLSITGSSGTRGWLQITVLSDATGQDPFSLYVPFELSSCPFGFLPWKNESMASNRKVRNANFMRESKITPTHHHLPRILH